MRPAIALLGASALLRCVDTGSFTCENDAQCTDGAKRGRCEPTGFCSFPDDSCESGQRYGDLASDSLAGQCTSGLAADGSMNDRGGDATDGGDGSTGISTPVLRSPVHSYPTGSVWAPETPGSALRPTLRWEPRDGVTHYEVELGIGCNDGTACEVYTATENVFTPEEALPVSLMPPVGDEYRWRVRACSDAVCSGWTGRRTLQVGRIATDYNGDGYADIAVGAPFSDSSAANAGAVGLYYGTTEELDAAPDLTFSAPLPQSGSRFGVALAAAGDVNGDGYADLIVGAPLATPNALEMEGAAYLFWGGMGEIDTSPVTLQSDDPEAFAEFGRAVAGAGDVNGDGFADVVVGAPGAGGAGTVFAFSGGPAFDGIAAQEIEMPMFTTGADYGAALSSVGDMDGNGFADVLVGAPNYSEPETNAGAVWLFLGTSFGLADDDSIMVVDPLGPGDTLFGASVASAGDIDNDGFSDAIIGQPDYDDGASSNSGRMLLFLGRRNPTLTDVTDDATMPMLQEDAGFGQAAVGLGDANGDGFDDLVVAAPDEDAGAEVDEGRVYGYVGATDDFFSSAPFTFAPPGTVVDIHFGFALGAVGDVDGDGLADFTVGPSATVTGGVVLYYGDTDDFGVQHKVVLSDGEPESGFGSALAGRTH